MRAEHCKEDVRVLDTTASYKRCGTIVTKPFLNEGKEVVRVRWDGFNHADPVAIQSLRRYDQEISPEARRIAAYYGRHAS